VELKYFCNLAPDFSLNPNDNMNIYLIRHGDAERISLDKKDYDRELTPTGKIKLKSAVFNWNNTIKEFDFIITSPLVRAIQTANIIAEQYNASDKIVIDKKLSPGCDTGDIMEIANSLSGEEIAFVGHQPDFSEVLSDLISHKGAFIDFKKGAIAKISFDHKVKPADGTLEFLIPVSVFNTPS
jgi:phosphohistidine phosphatase